MDITGAETLVDEIEDIEADYSVDKDKPKKFFRYVLSYGKYTAKLSAFAITLAILTTTVSVSVSLGLKKLFHIDIEE